MIESQETLLHGILKENAKRTEKKFRKGDAEHGGELGKKSPLWLLGEALDEATDLTTYLPTLHGWRNLLTATNPQPLQSRSCALSC